MMTLVFLLVLVAVDANNRSKRRLCFAIKLMKENNLDGMNE
jgi:hypothetical protein